MALQPKKIDPDAPFDRLPGSFEYLPRHEVTNFELTPKAAAELGATLRRIDQAHRHSRLDAWGASYAD